MGEAGDEATAAVRAAGAPPAPDDDRRWAGYVAAGGRATPVQTRVQTRVRRAAVMLLAPLALLVAACAQANGGRAAPPPGAAPDASPATPAPGTPGGPPQGMLVRISEIQIDPDRLERYRAILREEADASVRLEPGVVAIFPMYRRDDPAEVRILEVYASRAAYEAHLKTPHFARYKATTLPMVRALRLVDMEAIDAAAMPRMFGKLRGDG